MTVTPALALVNARIRTGDVRHPWADALLVRGDTIEFVGSSAEVKKRTSSEMRIEDMRGLTIVPENEAGILAAGARADLSANRGQDVVFSLRGGMVIVDLR